MKRQLLSSAEAAAQLGITKRGLHKMVEAQTIPATRVGNAFVFAASDVHRAKTKRPGRGRPAGWRKQQPQQQ